jgi:Ca2+-binding EF-hand superfamily protein
MTSLQTGQKGDLYIRFTMELPNFTTLPPDTISQLKKIFQSFDKE